MAKEIELYDLVLEVTRRCNMCCEHCLRGEAENVDLTKEIVDEALKDVKYISTITFSGGEPTLNVPIIQYVLEVCKQKNIDVYNFFVATNGKKVSRNFIMTMLDWYAYVIECGGEPEYCQVALSKDNFHESIDKDNENLLRGLSFFSNESKNTDFSKSYLIAEGRALYLPNTWKKDIREFSSIEGEWNVDDDSIRIEGMTYISANGDVKTDCDLSFDNDDYTIGNVKNDSLFTILSEALEENDMVVTAV
jgi:hypothetical protein